MCVGVLNARSAARDTLTVLHKHGAFDVGRHAVLVVSLLACPRRQVERAANVGAAVELVLVGGKEVGGVEADDLAVLDDSQLEPELVGAFPLLRIQVSHVAVGEAVMESDTAAGGQNSLEGPHQFRAGFRCFLDLERFFFRLAAEVDCSLSQNLLCGLRAARNAKLRVSRIESCTRRRKARFFGGLLGQCEQRLGVVVALDTKHDAILGLGRFLALHRAGFRQVGIKRTSRSLQGVAVVFCFRGHFVSPSCNGCIHSACPLPGWPLGLGRWRERDYSRLLAEGKHILSQSPSLFAKVSPPERGR